MNKTIETYYSELQLLLDGKHLLPSEIPFPKTIMNEYISHELIEATPGIIKQGKNYRCSRCNNETPRLFTSFPCALCQKECYYCRKCIMMGRVSTCTPLLRWKGPPVHNPHQDHSTYLTWNGTLSPGQKVASNAGVEGVRMKSDLTIWAVCGAGKTEVLFAAIDEALMSKLRVCIATPRTDVVLELAPRLKKVFPTIPVAVLYGGSKDRNLYAPLTISTTHQLLRFYQAFDLMIVDEVDAFPYSYDSSLQWAVKKSVRPQATTLYLTATPSETWQMECKYGKRNYVKIPARFHRQPLPIPQFTWCGNWRKQLEKMKIPLVVENWIQKRLNQNKQMLLFLPHIELMEKALPIFQKLHPKVEAVHAEDPNRKAKVEKMRSMEVPLLLTTTILERGVTFPNIDVAVLGAEDDIFTESALVQIAGRVGRSAEFPNGHITFFHYGRTKAMIRALVHIDDMNKEAAKKGMIDQ
ncbi:DEAD/DEAH box helicase [Bacillus niameyensis]|uniref:DEAD/DEAH box helicase n=1 Tax=Bacillus niameyensis TaxID=1522308 RepID=UPI000A970233|nr:DEAD/DEAH box helicase [Bacillus niameyensis]